MLHNFTRVGGKITATNYPTLLGKLLGYKPKVYTFYPKGTYKIMSGNDVYYDQFGGEWDSSRIAVYKTTGFTFPHK